MSSSAKLKGLTRGPCAKNTRLLGRWFQTGICNSFLGWSTLMPSSPYTLSFPGVMTQRGFWLYVCKITSPEGKLLLYVGMTGDKPSRRTGSPLERMAAHLGRNKNSNAIKRNLDQKVELTPEQCRSFEMIAHGPIFPATDDKERFDESWDKVAALERALRDALKAAGYHVLNNAGKNVKGVDKTYQWGGAKVYHQRGHWPA